MRLHGFTLIESVMVLIIIGILIVFVAPILTTAVGAYDQTSRNIEVLTKIRYTMERLAREMRSIRRDPVNTANYDIVTGSMTASTFEFCRADGTRVTISYSNPNLKLGYTTGFASSCSASAATTQNLSDAATSFTMAYVTAAGGVAAGKNDVAYVDITMTTTGTSTLAYTSSMRVDMRNP